MDKHLFLTSSFELFHPTNRHLMIGNWASNSSNIIPQFGDIWTPEINGLGDDELVRAISKLHFIAPKQISEYSNNLLYR